MKSLKKLQKHMKYYLTIQKRARYDQFGHEDPQAGFGGGGFSGGDGFGGFEDIFSSFFGVVDVVKIQMHRAKGTIYSSV